MSPIAGEEAEGEEAEADEARDAIIRRALSLSILDWSARPRVLDFFCVGGIRCCS